MRVKHQKDQVEKKTKIKTKRPLNKAESKVHYALQDLDVIDRNIQFHEDRRLELQFALKDNADIVRKYKRIKQRLIKTSPKGTIEKYREITKNKENEREKNR